MKKIIERYKAESPTFFKKVIAIGITLTAIGGGILALPATLSTAGIIIVLPAVVNTVGCFFGTAGAVAALIGKLTVKDPDVLSPKKD